MTVQAEPRLAPPYRVYRDFLAAAECSALIDFAIAHEADFEPTRVFAGLDRSARVSLGCGDFGVLQKAFQARARECSPEWFSVLGVSPFALRAIETGMVAHGDGAFFASHSDLLRDGGAKYPSARLVSAVYYFHREPKRFDGGELRLHYIDATAVNDRSATIPPENNMLVVFPSWVMHEVMPVSCPSGDFADSRFSINCWLHRATGRG